MSIYEKCKCNKGEGCSWPECEQGPVEQVSRMREDRDQLRQQLDAKEAEVDDLGDDLAQVKRQLAERDKQVMLLHFELFNSAEYIDTLGGTSLEARKTLAATEQWK